MSFKSFKKNRIRKKALGLCRKQERHKQLRPWQEIRSVGILYSVPEEPAYIQLTSIISGFQAEKKEVKALGLISGKETPYYCYPKLAYDYFGRKDLSWLGEPRGAKVNDFVEREFDLLINMDTCDNELFDYLVACSKAQLKAGLYNNSSTQIYDLMITETEGIPKEKLVEYIIEWIKKLCPGEGQI